MSAAYDALASVEKVALLAGDAATLRRVRAAINALCAPVVDAGPVADVREFRGPR